MNKLVQRIFVLTALLSCVALAAAQGGGGGQGRRGGQRGRGGNSELSLSLRPDVQKELAVTDDEKTKLTALQANQPRPNFGGGNGTPPDPAAMAKARAEAQAQQHKDLAAILSDTQMKRLGELLLQREGMNALTQDSVQKSLNFTSDQTAKVKDLQTKAQEANQAMQEKVRNQEMTREEAQAARTKNQQTMNDELSKVLTSDQAAKFKDMQGKPFTFEATAGRGGGGRGH